MVIVVSSRGVSNAVGSGSRCSLSAGDLVLPDVRPDLVYVPLEDAKRAR